ncbi:MAG: methyl-accepting chemotaxis protein [Desulfobacterales bacterium]|jgi:methyl-accepting chemotaxis protein|nr:methyl-accepting chemotaxis protein [Desulfobacterales bacterium]
MVAYKRRHLFINKEFQGKYIFSAFICVAAGSVLFALIFSFFSSNTLSIVYDNYHLKLGTTPGLLLNKILGAQWLFIVLGGIAVAIMTLFLTHRVAGPFFRFEKTLDLMTTKDLSGRIFLRKNDEGKNLGEKINAFNKMLSHSLLQMRQSAVSIKQCCDSDQATDSSRTQQDLLQAKLETIRQQNQLMMEILNGFKLTIE